MIPKHLPNGNAVSGRLTPETATPVALAKRGLERAGFVVLADVSGLRPEIVAYHAERGIVAVGVSSGDTDRALVDLNRKVGNLREEVPAVRRAPIERRVIDAGALVSDRKALTLGDAKNGSWALALRRRPVDDLVRADLDAAYRPALEVKLPSRNSMKDAGSGARAAVRLRLDAEQEAIVGSGADEELIVVGPPGSGKTLVLAARAKKLALKHPDWSVQVLCFNNMLIPYLRTLVGPFPNIDVTTFGKFASGLGHRISLNDETSADRDVAKAIPRLRANPRVDALLIDEAQDFLPAWIDFARASVRGGRGGMVVAGDPKQSLYRPVTAIDGGRGAASVRRVGLTRPYRSTRQILEVTSALSPGSTVESASLGFDGEPVDLIWATNQDEQAAAVARDVADLVQRGERVPQNIGVLVTRRWRLGKVAFALEKAGVPVRRLYDSQSEELDLAEPTVKVLTVHSAKGLDFDVVFLVGLEDLPDDESEESQTQGRVGYVGTTRAKDQLVITYSKDNAYLARIRGLDEDTMRRWVWPDDFPGA